MQAGYAHHWYYVCRTYRGNREDDIIYIGVNAFWEKEAVQLPRLPLGRKWRIIMNTEFEHTAETDYHKLTKWAAGDTIVMYPRSVVIAIVDKS